MKITISGTPASGKSSVGKLLAKKLGYRHYSMGDLQRQLAKEHKVDIVEMGRIESVDDKYDKMIDEEQVNIGINEENFVIDSWLGAKFIPDAKKIFIDANLSTRAKRRLMHKRREEQYDDLETVKEEMKKREELNRERWYRYYDFDYTDMGNYDIVIDTSDITIEEVVEKILDFIKTEALKTKENSKKPTASS